MNLTLTTAERQKIQKKKNPTPLLDTRRTWGKKREEEEDIDSAYLGHILLN